MGSIFTVLSSVVGLIAGLTSVLLFGASLLVGLVTYFAVSLVMIVAWAASSVFTARRTVTSGDTFEDMLDDSWEETENAMNAPTSGSDPDRIVHIDEDPSQEDQRQTKDSA